MYSYVTKINQKTQAFSSLFSNIFSKSNKKARKMLISQALLNINTDKKTPLHNICVYILFDIYKSIQIKRIN